jgi:1-acyl-sn-glycerol-3-phosphate acyltransferase
MNRLPAAGRIEDREVGTPAGYRLFRGLIRMWLRLARRPIRVLGDEPGTPRSGPLLLVAGHPSSFPAALILVAAFGQAVRCFLGAEHIDGFWAKLLGRGLGVIPDRGDVASLDAACRAADRGEALLAFADPEPPSGDGNANLGGRTARLTMELAKRLAGPDLIGAGEAPLALVPLHIFLPQPPLESLQVLIHLEPPVRPEGSTPLTLPERSRREAEHEEQAADSPQRAKELLAALDRAFRRNVFRLRPADLRDFLSDLEDVLRQDFESKPATPPERRPKLEGFALSEFLVNWAEQENCMDPGRLVSLRGELDSWRERRRTLALREIETETCGPWMGSTLRRSVAWAETGAGFPVAVFGLVNSLIALAVLEAAGLGRIEKRGESFRRWLSRAGMILFIFAVQTLIIYWRWGRSVAGAYAVTAPVSALYLWRYTWLLVHRSRLLFWKLLNARARAQLEKVRAQLLQDLNRARDAYAERLGVAH